MEIDEFQRLLLAAHLERQEQLAERWHRSLPFEDAMFDRWERARRLGFMEGASIYESAFVYGTVAVGAGTWVGPNVVLDGSGGQLAIGSTCSISAGVHIYTHDTVRWALSGGVAPRSTGPVTIGDRTHVGAMSIVTAGVRVGSGCVVGANSFVNRDVADATIVAGSPAVEIGAVRGLGDDVELVFHRHDV